MKKSLFEAVKQFVNEVPVGETFTSKSLIAYAGPYETLTSWKRWSSNPNYRTHTYKSYLSRAGFVTRVKNGLWKVEKHIHPKVTLGTIEFLIGYGKSDTYNGKTKSEWLDLINGTPSYIFKENDKVIFQGVKIYAAKAGAEAIVKKYDKGYNDETYLYVEWVRNGLDNGQLDGGYFESDFKLKEEYEAPKEVRILEETKEIKVMKDLRFNVDEGKQRIVEMLRNDIDNFEAYMLEDIKRVVNEDGENVVGQIENIIDSYRTSTHIIEMNIEEVNSCISIQEILNVLEDTMHDEETILCELFGLDSLTSI